MSWTRSAHGCSSSQKTRRWDRGLAAIAVASLVLSAAAWPTARSFEVIDKGTFTLYLGGTRIGDERFIIREESSGAAGSVVRAGAELTLKREGRTQRIGVALEVRGERCRPRRYEAEINGAEATSIVGTALADRIRLDIRSPEGDQMREFLMRGRAAIVEKQIAHHYYFIWKLLEGNPSAQATVIVPRDRSQISVRIEDMGMEPVRIGDSELELRHIRMVARSGSAHHAWLDGDKVMKVDVPDQEFVAVRSDTEDE